MPSLERPSGSVDSEAGLVIFSSYIWGAQRGALRYLTERSIAQAALLAQLDMPVAARVLS